MQQQTFAEVPVEPYRKPTRRDRFLDEMNRVVPRADLVSTAVSTSSNNSLPPSSNNIDSDADHHESP
jgi:hypothetical protein